MLQSESPGLGELTRVLLHTERVKRKFTGVNKDIEGLGVGEVVEGGRGGWESLRWGEST